MVQLNPLALLAAAAALLAPRALAQTLPLKTSGRWILDDTGARVKLRCINWAAHGETNTPEGLHKASVATLADFIKDKGFNCVRLTYSTEHALAPQVPLAESFKAAAGSSGLPEDTFVRLHAQVIEANPAFGSNTTRQDVFGAIIKALWDRKVMTILDNHVSKPSWCCTLPSLSLPVPAPLPPRKSFPSRPYSSTKPNLYGSRSPVLTTPTRQHHRRQRLVG